jgi:hypothetical protein
MTSALLLRIKFPLVLAARLDALALEIGAVVKHRVSRASVIRALVRLGLDTAVAPEIATAIGADPVRRGRDKGVNQTRRARP